MLYSEAEIPPPTVSDINFEMNFIPGLHAFYASFLLIIFEEAPTTYPATWLNPPVKPSFKIYMPSIFYPFKYFFAALSPAVVRPVPIEETEVWITLDFTAFKTRLQALAATLVPKDENPSVKEPVKMPKNTSTKNFKTSNSSS